MIHNHTPLAEVKHVPSLLGSQERNIPIFRFYFDGLIVHFHRHADDDGYTNSLHKEFAGNEGEMTVTTVTCETSFQRHNLETVMNEAIGWPPPGFVA